MNKIIVLCVVIAIGMAFIGACIWELIKLSVSGRKARKKEKHLAEEARHKEDQEIQKRRNELIEEIGIVFDQRLEIVEKTLGLLLKQNARHSGDDNASYGDTDIDNSETGS